MNARPLPLTGIVRMPLCLAGKMAEHNRFLIPQPMGTIPAENYAPPKPRLLNGDAVQVTAFTDEHMRLVERWQFSDTDVRWYEVVEIDGKEGKTDNSNPARA
jgi:hypothetical protein